jgi:hypothetical protein
LVGVPTVKPTVTCVYVPEYGRFGAPCTASEIWGVTVCANVAVTLLFAVMETVHEVVPVHAPDQPENVYPVWGVAVRVTEVPDVYVSAQSVPQEMPVPEMVPPPVTPVVRVYVAGGGGVEVPTVYEYVRPFVRGSVLSEEAKRMDCVVVSPQ